MPVRLGPMFKIIPATSPSPRGRRDLPSLSLPHGRDGRETPVRAGEWVWARVGARVIELLLVFGIVATATSDETGRRFTLGGTRRGESLRMKLSRIGLLALACGIATLRL